MSYEPVGRGFESLPAYQKTALFHANWAVFLRIFDVFLHLDAKNEHKQNPWCKFGAKGRENLCRQGASRELAAALASAQNIQRQEITGQRN